MTEEHHGNSRDLAVMGDEYRDCEVDGCNNKIENNSNGHGDEDRIDDTVLGSSLQTGDPVIDISRVVGKKSWVDTSSRRGLIGFFTTLPQMWKVILAVAGFFIALVVGAFWFGHDYANYDNNTVKKTDPTFISAAAASDLSKWDSSKVVGLEQEIKEIKNGQIETNSKIDRLDVKVDENTKKSDLIYDFLLTQKRK